MGLLVGACIESSRVYLLIIVLGHHGFNGCCLYWVITSLLVGVCIRSYHGFTG